MSEEERTLKFDIHVEDWPMLEQMAYREKVKVTPQYAILKIGECLELADAERKADPDSIPPSLLNIPPEYVIGLCWIPGRRDDRKLTYESIVETVHYEDLLDALVTAVEALPDVEDGEPPLANRETRRAAAKSSRPSKPASPSAKSSAGGSTTSRTSPRKSSPPPSSTPTPD